MDHTTHAKSWASTLRHLSACRLYLPEDLASSEAEVAANELVRFLHRNEFKLALDEAEALGEVSNAPASFWWELHLAAVSMGLSERAIRYTERMGRSDSSPGAHVRYEEVVACEAVKEEGLVFIKVTAMPYQDPAEFNLAEARAFSELVARAVEEVESGWMGNEGA